MSAARRVVLFVPAAIGVAVLLGWGLAGLPRFGASGGPYGSMIRAVAVHQRHATNVVDAVVFDYRSFDTLGEEFIFLAAVIGVTMLLRAQREESEGPPRDIEEDGPGVPVSDAVRVASLALVAPLAAFGMYLVVHGHLTPGGGFQGGVVLGSAPVLVYLSGRYRAFRALTPVDALDLEEGAGAAGFVLVGLVGMIASGVFLENVFPLGRVGAVFSAGMMPILNLTVGLEIAAGVVLVVSEFLEQTLIVRKG
jgi:multicomponent Na+:H+ antiporter subunit B